MGGAARQEAGTAVEDLEQEQDGGEEGQDGGAIDGVTFAGQVAPDAGEVNAGPAAGERLGPRAAALVPRATGFG